MTRDLPCVYVPATVIVTPDGAAAAMVFGHALGVTHADRWHRVYLACLLYGVGDSYALVYVEHLYAGDARSLSILDAATPMPPTKPDVPVRWGLTWAQLLQTLPTAPKGTDRIRYPTAAWTARLFRVPVDALFVALPWALEEAAARTAAAVQS